MPIIFSNGENRYDNWCDLEPLTSVWEWVNENNKEDDFENELCCFSETPMKENTNIDSFVKLRDVTVKLHKLDFSRVSNINLLFHL